MQYSLFFFHTIFPSAVSEIKLFDECSVLTEGKALANITADAIPKRKEFFWVKSVIFVDNETGSFWPPPDNEDIWSSLRDVG